jgi:hypothetical protein
MKAIRLYRHPECERCAGYARMHHSLDWLNRFEDSTQTPADGPLRVGEIAVQDLRKGVVLRGIACFRLLCKQVPAYWLLLPLTYLPPVRRRIEKDICGCLDGACEIPARQ